MRDAFRRFRKNRGSIIAACIILLLVLFAIFAPIISNYDLSEKKIHIIKKQNSVFGWLLPAQDFGMAGKLKK
ncbi:MAG: hypothetical protein L6V85_04770 [Clostridiales bacterium]|nr:MAG: hypothetical protein L6V85_04770 [Clostridiales bacterium]